MSIFIHRNEEWRERTNENGLFSGTFRSLVDVIQSQEIVFNPFMIKHHIDCDTPSVITQNKGGRETDCLAEESAWCR